MRSRLTLLSAGWFAVLVLIVLFGRGWVRGSFGDLAVVPWLAATLGILWPRPIFKRALAALAVAVGLECLQLVSHVQPEDPLWVHLIFGSTFDPWDLLHYGLGAALGVGIERALQGKLKNER